MTARQSLWWRLAPLLILLVALLPRVVSLGTFVTADEPTWLERSIWFVVGLTTGDSGVLGRSIYGDTLGAPASALPGLLPMPLPLAGFGATAFLTSALTGGPVPGQQVYADTIALLGRTAWFTALLSSLAVVGAYWLLRSLWGQSAALWAALVLALDPYFIGLSRVVGVDALLSSFMLLAALALIRTATSAGRRQAWSLLLAGLWSFLALLTKMPALFLVPFAGVAFVYGAVNSQPGSWKHRMGFLVAGLGWALVVLAAAFVLLIAWWPTPSQALEALASALGAGVTEAHEGGSYAYGLPGQPLDASFYVWVLALRVTPLTLLGLGLAVGAVPALIRRWRKPEAGAVLLLVVYLVGFALMMTLGAKKQDRYILPALLALDLLAAWGWSRCAALHWVLDRLPRLRRGRIRVDRWALAVGCTLALLVAPFWLRLHPYYLAAYNPLLGGSRTAAWAYAVGWGEGLDQAAAYLRQTNPDAADVMVASHMAQALGAEFPGFVVPLTTDTQYVADYTVLYYADALRNVPEPWVINRYRSLRPAFIAWIDGVPYAGVYRNPDLPERLVSRHRPPVHQSLDVALGRWVRCIGYDVGPSSAAAASETVSPGTRLPVTWYWECLEPMSVNYRIFVQLVDGTGHVWGQWDHEPVQGHLATSLWQPGMFVRDAAEVLVPAEAPAGAYQLKTGLYDPGTLRRLRIPGTGDDTLVVGPITVSY